LIKLCTHTVGNMASEPAGLAPAPSAAATRKHQQQQSKLVETLTKRSRFNLSETEGLLALYRQLLSAGSQGQNGGGKDQQAAAAQVALANQDRLDRTKFREFLHNSFEMTDDILLDRYCVTSSDQQMK